MAQLRRRRRRGGAAGEIHDASPPPSSPVDYCDFLDSSTQIARDIDGTAAAAAAATTNITTTTTAPAESAPPDTKRQDFPSFTSDFDDDTLAELDSVVEELTRSQSPGQRLLVSTSMLPPPRPTTGRSPKAMSRPEGAAIMFKGRPPGDLDSLGIRYADLEQLANSEIVPSQMAWP